MTSARVPDAAVSRSIVINRRFSAAVICPECARSDALTCNKVAAMAVRPFGSIAPSRCFLPTEVVAHTVRPFSSEYSPSPHRHLSLFTDRRTEQEGSSTLTQRTARAHYRCRQQPVESRPCAKRIIIRVRQSTCGLVTYKTCT